MKGQKIVVVGGSSGLGLAIAQATAKLGAEVIIAGRSKAKLEKARQTIGPAEIRILDVTKETELAQGFSSIGPFDHLVTTAADFIMGPFTIMETREAKRFFDSKFWGQYCAAKYAVPHMRKGGSITFFCGFRSQRPMMHFSAGAAINAAIEGLTRALALELAPLRVNAISPGNIITPVWDVVPEKERMAQFQEEARKLPVRRIGQPEDIAQAALFLMQCGFTTGSVVHVDGGIRLI